MLKKLYKNLKKRRARAEQQGKILEVKFTMPSD